MLTQNIDVILRFNVYATVVFSIIARDSLKSNKSLYPACLVLLSVKGPDILHSLFIINLDNMTLVSCDRTSGEMTFRGLDRLPQNF